jgi:hypothetical protein
MLTITVVPRRRTTIAACVLAQLALLGVAAANAWAATTPTTEPQVRIVSRSDTNWAPLIAVIGVGVVILGSVVVLTVRRRRAA